VLFLKQDSSFGSSVNVVSCNHSVEKRETFGGYFLGQCNLAQSKSNISYNLVLWISTFSSRSKSSPEQLNFLCSALLPRLNLQPISFPWCRLIHIKIEKRINNATLISHSTIRPAMFMDSSSTKLPRNARGDIIRGNSIPSKNNLRGIRMGIGPI